MITRIYIDGFKCHTNLNIELSNLNLLVGTNSSGKSTIIQAVLLASHNLSATLNSSPLNGHLVSVGNFKEARNYMTNSKRISIKIFGEGEILELSIREDDKLNDGKLILKKKTSEVKKILDYSNNRFHYLSAHRFGNQDLHSKNYDNNDLFGIYGEYAIDYFDKNKSNPLIKELIKDNNSYTLETQVNYWLKEILRHKLTTTDIEGTDKKKAEYQNYSGRIVRGKNTGSGVSYIISIVISCLASKPGDFLIIENPEIHLHPKAQSKLSEFFVFIANAGIQLMIETHSDHIFNGTRVKVYDKELSIDKLRVHFFTNENENESSNHANIIINEYGRIENQKDLLFDQFDDDVNSLLGL